MSELKPCPFCGSEASIVEVAERPEAFAEEAFIQCEECGFSIHHKWLSVETLIKYWNKRAESTCEIVKDTFDWKCSKCGNVITEQVNYCSNCGARVIEDE